MIAGGAAYFPGFDGVVYLNCAAQSPLPLVTQEAMHEAVGRKSRPDKLPDSILFEIPDRARRAIAPLIGARPEDVFIGAGASHGSAVAALGFPWKPGDEVLLAANEFPANLYIWANAARRAGGKAVFVKGRRHAAATGEILEAVTGRTRAIMVSLVDFGSGEVQDSERLREACSRRGIFLGLDATQAAGVVPLDVATLGANLLTVGGYKWMLGPYGAGFGWLDLAWYDRIDPTYVTWTAAEGAEDYNNLPREDWRWVATARRFDGPETASYVNATGLARSAELLSELGLEAVNRHVTGLLAHLESGLPRPYRRRAGPSAFPSPILLVEADDTYRVHRTYRDLREAGFWVSLRDDGIRISPHVYNTPGDMDRLLELLASS